jgi:hypothetical protein
MKLITLIAIFLFITLGMGKVISHQRFFQRPKVIERVSPEEAAERKRHREKEM